MVDTVLFVKSGDRFGADLLAARRDDHADSHGLINGSDRTLDHLAAEVLFCDDAICSPAVKGTDGGARPFLWRHPATQIGQHIPVPIMADAGNDDPTFRI